MRSNSGCALLWGRRRAADSITVLSVNMHAWSVRGQFAELLGVRMSAMSGRRSTGSPVVLERWQPDQASRV